MDETKHLIALGRSCEVLVTPVCHEDIVFNAYATNWEVPQKNFPIDVPRMFRIRKVNFAEGITVEVASCVLAYQGKEICSRGSKFHSHARLDGHYHTLFKKGTARVHGCFAHLKINDRAHMVSGCHQWNVGNIVNFQSQVMAESVGKEC